MTNRFKYLGLGSMNPLRDKPELETLKYKPIKKGFLGLCANVIKPAKAPPAPMGLNSAVIKPETRVNKTDDAEQHFEQPNKRLEYYHQPHCHAPSHVKQFAHGVSCSCRKPEVTEQPNQDLMTIEEIEGLMSQVNEKLGKLKAKFCEGEEIYQVQAWHRSRAIEEIDLFQKTTLFDLRKAFE